MEKFSLFTEDLSLNSSIIEDEFAFESNYSSFNNTNATELAGSKRQMKLNVPYALVESLVALIAVLGNALVIIVFCRHKKLRKKTNYYILSLAIADVLIGLLGIPFAVLVSQDEKDLPNHSYLRRIT